MRARVKHGADYATYSARARVLSVRLNFYVLIDGIEKVSILLRLLVIVNNNYFVNYKLVIVILNFFVNGETECTVTFVIMYLLCSSHRRAGAPNQLLRSIAPKSHQSSLRSSLRWTASFHAFLTQTRSSPKSRVD